MTSTAPTLALSGGTRMPQIALGTWPLDDHEAEKALLSAIEVGYRHVDTAENYENERGVGPVSYTHLTLPTSDLV